MSTVKATNFQNASSATANMVTDASGNVSFGGTAAMSSSFLRNRIINGDMRVDQRNAGASGTTGDLIFETVNDAYNSSTERMRIKSSGALTVTVGSTNATQYTPITSTGGSTLFVDQQQTTSVSTTATVILASPRYATLALVHGSDGTNRFSDLVLMSVGTGTVNVISSLTASGSPAARTYSQTSSTFRLAMASGTYTVRVASIGMNS